jgi:putative glutathione S-transferase
MRQAHTALDEMDDSGEFKRTASGFTSRVAPGTRFSPESGRYHLYIALACPWAAGCLSALYLKGLEGVIGHSIAHSTWARTRPDDANDTHHGWHFRAPGDDPVTNSEGHGSFECDDALIPDTVNGCKTVREIYDIAGDEFGKYTTPILWDTKHKTIVSNESTVILRILNDDFHALANYKDVNIYPEELQEETDKLNSSLIYNSINNGVYRCGFATKQKAYEAALDELFGALDEVEGRLAASTTTYLTGEKFTWLDLRLYHTLVRFDPVYVVYFKCNRRRIEDYPHLLRYVRSVYKIPAMKATTNIRHIKMHYFSSHPALNKYGIIPASNGPKLE